METFSVLFYLKKEKIRKDGKAPIYARITVNRKRAELAIKRYIDPAVWDANKGSVKGTKSASRELNSYLDAIRNKLYRHQRELLDQGEPITAQALKRLFLGISPEQHTLRSLFEYQLARMAELTGTEIAPTTFRKSRTTANHVLTFLRLQHKREDMPLKQLRLSFVTDFDHYLRTRLGIGNNTTVKYVSIFRKFIRVAIRNDWLEKDPFQQYDGRQRIVDREYLTEAELQRMAQKEFRIPRLTQIRDIFLFSCYTGLAYSDVGKLTADHVFRGVDGQYWININRTKTDTKSMIPILPPAMAILERYEDSVEAQAKGLLLPVKSNQKMNAYLKEIADLCGIEKKLTFHMARHTFATTVTLSNGVPIESVSAMLGHKDIKTTQHYAKIVQRKVGEDMQALRDKLFSGEKKSEEAKVRKIS